MPAKKERRQSIAVAGGDKVQVPNRKRRAHSIGGALLSPAAKRRRSLAPRKSILKASINTLLDEADDSNGGGSASQETEYEAEVTDKVSRKSLGPRVSFASMITVRMFQTHDQHTTQPSSSPVPDQTPGASGSASSTNENAYPRAITRRRSSVRQSMGEASMDLDEDSDDGEGNLYDFLPPQITPTETPPPYSPISGPDDQQRPPEEDAEDENGEMDMEMTDVHRRSMGRRKSSIARKPLAEVAPSSDSLGDTESADMSMVSDPTEPLPVEFQHPVNKSLRPQRRPSEAWLALQAITGSIEEPFDPSTAQQAADEDDTAEQSMELDDTDLHNSIARIKQIREGMGLPETHEEEHTDSSLMSLEESMREDEGGHDNQTMNVAGFLRRQSLAAATAEPEPEPEPEPLPPPPAALAQVPQTPQVKPPSSVFIAPRTGTKPVSVFSAPPPRTGSVFSRPGAGAQTPKPTAAFTAPTPRTVTKPAGAGPPAAKSSVFTAPVSPPKLGKVFSTPKPGAQSKGLSFASASKPTPGGGGRGGSHPTSSPSRSRIFTRPTSPVKSKPTYSAAFAPPAAKPTPKKRVNPPPPEVGDHLPSPPKRLKELPPVSQDEVAPPVPVPSSSRAASPPKAASAPEPAAAPRRASGYFARRKSLATGASRRMSVIPEPGEVPAPHVISVNKGKGRADPIVELETVASPPSPALSPVRMEEVSVPVPDFVSPAAIELEVSESALQDERGDVVENDQRMAHPEEDMDVDNAEEYNEEDEGPPISLEQFFSMTGIDFLNELTVVRRSSIHPGQLGSRVRRGIDGSALDIPLAEYVVAMTIEIPQLELTTSVIKDLQNIIEQTKVSIRQIDEDAQKMTPGLFREFSYADEESKVEITHHLKLIRTNARLMSKAAWHSWKGQWLQQMFTTAEQGIAGLKVDEEALAEINRETDAVLPALREEYAQILHELKAAEAAVEEVQNCDQDYLAELKATIAEQNVEVESLRNGVSEGNASIALLDQKLAELELDKHANASAIAESRRLLDVQKNGTKAEVYKLKAELQSLEDLHMWWMTSIDLELIEFVYAKQFRVSIPCVQLQPIPGRVQISKDTATSRQRDQHPQLSAYLLNVAISNVAQGSNLTVQQIVNRLSDYWFACSQIRLQIKLLQVKFPVSVTVPLVDGNLDEGFTVRTTVLIPTWKAKAMVNFTFSLATLRRWPMSANQLTCKVTVVYGDIAETDVYKVVSRRLAEVTADERNTCLLDACVDAMEV